MDNTKCSDCDQVKCVCDKAEKWAKSVGAKPDPKYGTGFKKQPAMDESVDDPTSKPLWNGPAAPKAGSKAGPVMKSEGAHGHCLGCNCVEKALPSMANFQSLASHPTAKPTAGAGAKPSTPGVKTPLPKAPGTSAEQANKEIGSFQSLAKPVKKGLPGAHLFPKKPGA